MRPSHLVRKEKLDDENQDLDDKDDWDCIRLENGVTDIPADEEEREVAREYNLVDEHIEMDKHDIEVERDIISGEPVEVVVAKETDENEESDDVYQGEPLELGETDEDKEEPKVQVENIYNSGEEEEELHVEEEEEKEEVTRKEADEDEEESELEREREKKEGRPKGKGTSIQ